MTVPMGKLSPELEELVRARLPLLFDGRPMMTASWVDMPRNLDGIDLNPVLAGCVQFEQAQVDQYHFTAWGRGKAKRQNHYAQVGEVQHSRNKMRGRRGHVLHGRSTQTL